MDIKVCKNCGREIPARGRWGHDSQVLYCSKECNKENGNTRNKDRQRLFPEGTDRFNAVGLAGTAAESIATANLLLRGYQVYKPVSATARNDLIVEIENRLYRVQVKSVRRQNGKLVNKYERRLDSRFYDILANVALTENFVEYEPALESLAESEVA